MPHISLAAEKLGTLWGVPVTNALLTAWMVLGLLLVLSILVTRKMTLVPGNGQSIAELLVGGLYDFFTSIAGKHIKQFFPLLASIFIFVITANWVGLLPGVGTIGFFSAEPKTEVQEAVTSAMPVAGEEAIEEHIVIEEAPAQEEAPTISPGEALVEEEEHEAKFTPLFRGATADINTTLALAITAVVAIQYFGFKTLGLHYSTRFLSFKSPISFFVGLLELVSEISKIISFAFRLFGNIFAGEVLLTVIAFLMPFILPLPFLMLELFVGFIQALVFSMLTGVFLSVAVSHGEGEAH
jgi:F-type H+-transporting ATPase subunit a